ncbi:NB-ARC domain-containing protein [Lentzea xinjiangensis]|uniref:NB-ARC domain-containing protein n=1 Tax=Lentzea xinjiangensis TaxID=402600 RepID=A0A1H9WD65_9PSEU|nr:tetratricopeptide repeat protein [Lentzea xinjiangensis]SES31413.1 NB-ARC domain-containing protein [Lentzea xinjiangensis]
MADRLRALRDALAARPGEPVPFDALIAEVWPDGPPMHPRAALRTLVSRLRGTEQVVTEPAGYRLVPRPPAPCQLPADLPDFVGRREEIARLELIDAPVRAITGLPGVGKTVLAVREAHRLRERFPDGQLYVNLRGFSTGPPMTAEQALARFVKALGGGPDDDYRELLRHRRVLVVLDNATAGVVAPLLPATPGCAALVTSRQDLPQFAQVRLGVLTDQEARELLKGMRVDGDTGELVELCGRLPLALRIAGANLAGRHLQDYVEELREHRLDALEIEGDTTAVRATFDLSYRELSPRARRTFDFLGAVPGQDIPRGLAGPAADELVAANLVQRNDDRYQLHDLLRLYAHRRATADDRRAVFDWYLRHADGAEAQLKAGFTRLLPPVPDPVAFTGHDEAVAWFEAERPNLVALAEDRPDAALVAALRTYLLLTGQYADLRTIARAALDRGETGQRAAAMRVCLAYLDWRFGEHRTAIEHGERAIAEYRAAGARPQEASALNILAGIYHDVGELGPAREHLAAAIEIYEADGLRPQLVGGLANLGLVELELGRLSSAEDVLRRSVRLARESDDWQHLANGLNNLGVVLAARHRYAEGEQAFHESLDLAREHGLRPVEMSARVEYAELLLAAGRPREAREQAGRALELAGGDDLLTEVDACLVLAEVNRSVAEYDEVLRRAVDAEFRIIEVRALAGKAALVQDEALYDKAIERAESAGLRYRADLVRELKRTSGSRPRSGAW